MRRLVQRVRGGCATAGELVVGVWHGPYWWLVPVMAILLPAAVVFIVLQASPVVAPFVYTLF